jgi:16S rRNA (uracil1498-N3)-methyltransferase
VTAPVFVVSPDALAGVQDQARIRLDGPEGRHAVTVRRLVAGEAIDLVDGEGTRVTGRVVAVEGKDGLEVAVDTVSHEPPAQPTLVVAQALPKGDRGELAVELLTEVGVDEIVPWAAANCITRWRDERAGKSWQKWADAARSAGKQSRRARFPVLAPLTSTDDLVARAGRAACALVLHESAVETLTSVLIPPTGEVLVVVGPEGGISPTELDALAAAGARSVRLGPSVLRTSSAGMAAAAVVLSRTGRWSAPVGPDTVGVEG